MKRKVISLLMIMLSVMMTMQMSFAENDDMFSMAEKYIKQGMNSPIVKYLISPILIIVGIGLAVGCVINIFIIMVTFLKASINTSKGDKATGEKLSVKLCKNLGSSLFVTVLIGGGGVFLALGFIGTLIDSTVPNIVPQIQDDIKDTQKEEEKEPDKDEQSYIDYMERKYRI